MLKEVFASNAAKLVAACVCPIAAGTVALKVPPVRSAIHKATAPKPEREARAKPRIRAPLKKATVERDDQDGPIAAAPMCPDPVKLNDSVLTPTDIQPELPAPRTVSPVQLPTFVSNCGPSGFMMDVQSRMTGAVPEPATWAQMVAGFALMGATLRAGRRRQRRAAGA
jgi:hypothetical protein